MRFTDISAVDLFCGVGGLTHGFIRSGVGVSAGFDIDNSCEYVYEINNNTRFFAADISKITTHDIARFYPEGHIKVLAGCAPCQPFSAYSYRYDKKPDDQRWSLLKSFARIIRGIEPEIVSMENVPLLKKHAPFAELLRVLEKMRYYVNYQNIRCETYGVPQKRTRLVLLASRLGKIDLIPSTHEPNDYVTVRDSIGDLEKIDDGGCSETDPLHRAQKLRPLNKKRIMKSVPGGTWHDWGDDLICPCHKKKTGSSYAAVYGRMSWDLPSPTITTQFFNYGSGRFGHPDQDRALSLREGANLQSFPHDYIFTDPRKPVLFKECATHIGNAVPVRLGEIIGLSIKEHCEVV
jgi:DNA (cytosine-5)-methyltransferase 1